MSYRNPGQIYIANPNAFMEAFEKGIAPVKAELERKAAERKERAQKYDSANAKLKQSLQYPEWVKKYGKQKADTIRSMVEEDYISNNRFASATQSEQQDMLDELNVNISTIANKTDAALQLDYDEILPGHFAENKEFLDFLASKPDSNNDISLERVNGQVGFSYMKDGKKLFLSADQIPDGAMNYQGKTATNQAISSAIDAVTKEVDDKFTSAKTLTGAAEYTRGKAGSIYSALDDSQKEYLFEKMQIDLNGKEEGMGDYTYADVQSNPELKKIVDEGIVEYITGEIELDSRQLTRIKSEEQDRIRKNREKQAEELRKQGIETQENLNKAVVIDNNITSFGFGDRNPAGEVMGVFDPNIINDDAARKRMVAGARNMGFEIGDAITAKDEDGKTITDEAGNPVVNGIEVYPIGKKSQKFVIENGITPQELTMALLQYKGIKSTEAAKFKTAATEQKAGTTSGLPTFN